MTDKQNLLHNNSTLLIVNEKGGVRKTELTVQLTDILLLRGLSVRVFEIDDQNRVASLFEAETTLINLPVSDELIENDQADIDALDPVFSSILKEDNAVTLVDTGANFDARLFEAILLSGTASMVANTGLVTILVPFTAHSEAVAGAIRTIKRGMKVFPKAKIVPVQCCSNDELSRALSTSENSKEFDTTIAPFGRDGGFFKFNTIRNRALESYETIGVRPSIYCAKKIEDIAKNTASTTSSARTSQLQMAMHMADLESEVHRTLSFRFQSGDAK